MRFGVFYEHQIPRPWDPDSELRQFQQALDQVALADRLGFDVAWQVEHHFMEEYSHSSAPEVFLAAASQRTTNIRLGHAIVQLTTNHPARVAERVATLDLVSNGRVELGTGEGSSVTELHPFNRRRRDKRAVWEEAIQVLTGMLTSDRFEWHGEWFDFPARNVIPKPVQHPHPPLWVACSNIQTIEMAARRGLGALGFQFLTPEAAQAWVNRYYRLFVAEREPLAPYQVNPNVAIVCGFMCADTDEEARAKAEGWTFFQFALGYYGKHGALEPGAHNLWEEYLHWRRTPEGQAAEGGLIGSPETIRAQLEALQAAHVDQVILLNQAGKNTHADICHSLELFASELLEEFHGYEDDHQAWKEAVLSGEVDLLDLDTAAFHRYLGQPEINIPVTTA